MRASAAPNCAALARPAVARIASDISWPTRKQKAMVERSFAARLMLIDKCKRWTSDSGRRLGDPRNDARRDEGPATRRERWGDERGERRKNGCSANQNVEVVHRQCHQQPQAPERTQKPSSRDPGRTRAIQRRPLAPGNVEVEREHQNQQTHRYEIGRQQRQNRGDDEGETDSDRSLHEARDHHARCDQREYGETHSGSPIPRSVRSQMTLSALLGVLPPARIAARHRIRAILAATAVVASRLIETSISCQGAYLAQAFTAASRIACLSSNGSRCR